MTETTLKKELGYGSVLTFNLPADLLKCISAFLDMFIYEFKELDFHWEIYDEDKCILHINHQRLIKENNINKIITYLMIMENLSQISCKRTMKKEKLASFLKFINLIYLQFNCPDPL